MKCLELKFAANIISCKFSPNEEPSVRGRHYQVIVDRKIPMSIKEEFGYLWELPSDPENSSQDDIVIAAGSKGEAIEKLSKYVDFINLRKRYAEISKGC